MRRILAPLTVAAALCDADDASGVGSHAQAGGGNQNTAIASTDGCTASAVGDGVSASC